MNLCKFVRWGEWWNLDTICRVSIGDNDPADYTVYVYFTDGERVSMGGDVAKSFVEYLNSKTERSQE